MTWFIVICASGAREGNIMIWDLRCTGTVNENGGMY